MDAVSLISLLSDGNFHSGSELGQALGVSRTAVWKSLSQLERYGLSVESIKGKGYRLVRPLELLDVDRIRSHCSFLPPKCEIRYRPVVDSTNVQLLECEPVTSDYLVLLTEMQTAGRGRRGRNWVSPFAQNLYLSLRFELIGGPEVLSGLSLVVGLSIVRALKAFGDAALELKWPNDVMLDGRKLAGILVELQGDPTSAWDVVVGLGLNFNMSDQDAAGIDQPWISAAPHFACSRNDLCAKILQCLVEDMDSFISRGFEGFKSDWESIDFFKNKKVYVVGSELEGESVGLDVQGNLLLACDGEVKAVNAGEVSVRSVNSRT